MAGSPTAHALWTSGVLLVGFVLICCWVSAANTAALGVALVVISWDSRWRFPMLVACTVIVALAGVSQLVLGVHYPSDILAGWVWAAGFVLLASCVVSCRHERQRAKVEDR